MNSISYKSPVIMFECNITTVYECDDGMRESSCSYAFIAENCIEAINSALRVTARADENKSNIYPKPFYRKPIIGCVVIYKITLFTVDKDGDSNINKHRIFEWKYDWPGSLNEHADICLKTYTKESIDDIK